MIKEILCQTAVDREYQPDGGSTPVLDAYDGCTLRCPYCFQWQDPTWSQDILVKTNFPEVLRRELEGWDPAQTLYVGSRSDPYMEIEGKYRLTREILKILLARGLNCILSTKSTTPAFYDDIDLFRQFGDTLTICIGQANLAHLRTQPDPKTLPNIRAANELARLGIPVWVFITPVLPEITDVPGMIKALPADMPVFLDRLRLEPNSAFRQRFFDHLGAHFPSLAARYDRLMQEGTDPYYRELKERYEGDARVRFVFREN